MIELIAALAVGIIIGWIAAAIVRDPRPVEPAHECRCAACLPRRPSGKAW